MPPLGKWIPLAERFERYVDRSGGPDACWPWTGSATHLGYGLIRGTGSPGKQLMATRVSWELAYGFHPGKLFVCHRCDNPPCVNPSHLFLGTHQDNMDDMVRKGRQRPRGGLPKCLRVLSEETK